MRLHIQLRTKVPHLRVPTTVSISVPRATIPNTAVTFPSMSPSQSSATRTSTKSGTKAAPSEERSPPPPEKQPLPLPEPPTQASRDATVSLDVSGDGTTVKLAHLGPLVAPSVS
jgi:type IV secretory pathway VirJ component